MPHQKRFVDENPPKALLNWETRAGKSLAVVGWLEQRTGSKVIVCPKQTKKDWEAFETGAVILSKEEFKKVAHTLSPDCIAVSEAHYFAAPLFTKDRSQMAVALYDLVKRNPNMDVLLETATPVRNNAWSLHSLLCYLGVYYEWRWWRGEFFELKKMPFLRFPAWFPKSDWRERLKPYVEKHTDIVSLKDIVADLPPAENKVIKIKHKKPYQKPEDEIVTWTHEHQWEQEGKVDEILKLGYRKVILLVHYTVQIDNLKEALSAEKPVFVLDGRTKDADAVKRGAQEADECYFIVQSSLAFGFDGWQFGALVFVSMSHSNVHHIQSLGRQRHVKHLLTPVNVYLLGGVWDQRIYNEVIAGRDFSPHSYAS